MLSRRMFSIFCSRRRFRSLHVPCFCYPVGTDSRVLWSIDSNSSASHRQFSARKNGGTNREERNGEDGTEDEDESLLVRERMATIPNLICVLRIATTPLLGYLVVHEQFWPACILFIISGVTDVLDGSIARHFPSQRSLLGSFLDPIADKFLISTLFITLTYMQLISVPVTVVVFGRDFLLVLGSIFLRYKMLDPPVTIRRFFDTTVSAMQIRPTQLSKYNTFFQLALVSLSLAAPVFNFSGHSALQYLQFFTVLTTVSSGLQYVLRSGMLRVKFRKK